MTNEIHRQISRSLENKKKLLRRRKYIFGIVTLIFIVVAFTYFFKFNNLSYHTYKIVSSIPNKGDVSKYINYRDGIIKYSNNGAVAFGKNGKELWNCSYEMSDPIADVCGKYAVFADREGKLVYICSKKGFISNFSVLYDISDVDIASQGMVAVQMFDLNYNYVQFYYENGHVVGGNVKDRMLVDLKKDIINYGYLMDIALSEDGTKLAVDFVNNSSSNIHSTLGFYNYGEVGQNKIDNFVGAFPYEDTIIPRIVFLNKNVVCAFKDSGFVIYKMLEIPKLINDKTFDRKIKSIIYNSKYIGVILERKGSAPEQLLLYDLNGRRILNKEIDFIYDKIYLSGNDIIMCDNNTCIILKPNGKMKFKNTFNTRIEAIYSINHRDRYILITSTDVSIIVLGK